MLVHVFPVLSPGASIPDIALCLKSGISSNGWYDLGGRIVSKIWTWSTFQCLKRRLGAKFKGKKQRLFLSSLHFLSSPRFAQSSSKKHLVLFWKIRHPSRVFTLQNLPSQTLREKKNLVGGQGPGKLPRMLPRQCAQSQASQSLKVHWQMSGWKKKVMEWFWLVVEFQPIWKNRIVKLGSSSPIFGVKIKRYLKPPPSRMFASFFSHQGFLKLHPLYHLIHMRKQYNLNQGK